MFKVQAKRCDTCIYSKNSPLDLKQLLKDISDPNMAGFYRSYRICHHSKDACCSGFWEANKDNFPVGQVAQRLKLVQLVDEDILRST